MMPREIIWRAAAALVFAIAFIWALSTGRWGVAGIVGVLGAATILFLGVAIYVWRRRML
jgi:uncharacterized membrane protein